MLQQTTTQAVQGYFDRFIQAFPTIPSLAAADLETVNRHWEGLGYYRRCAHMHQAAKEIVARFGGVFPDRYEDVLRLPGIGRYTAGAILSIAFDQRLPILEANTFRLHARLLAIRGDLMRGEANERLWKFAEEILPRSGSGKLNQALMDLGSLLCTPKSPKCTKCPVAVFCESARQGLQADIPSPKTKEQPEYRTEVALLLRKRGKTFLIRYPEGQRWAGLWDFPRAETRPEPGRAVGSALVQTPGNPPRVSVVGQDESNSGISNRLQYTDLPLAEDMGLRKRLAELTGRKLIP